jgi:ABC-type branched-subunit amino acid transport system ATPase component
MSLEVQNLRKSFGGLTAIDDLSFSIEKNAVTSLIGPNGAGKSTVFNLITSFLIPDSGHVFYRDTEITAIPPHTIANLGIVRTFQDVKIFNKLSVRENILLGLSKTHQQGLFASILWGVSGENKRYMKERTEELLQFIGLEAIGDERAENISYAEKKLVILARALATDAELIMLDEPAAGLSEESVNTIMGLLKRLIKEGKTIFLVEHNMDLVLQISDHIIVLNFGKKIADGDPEAIKQNDKVIEVYLGMS